MVPEPPANLTFCADYPKIPSEDQESSKSLAIFILDLSSAYLDCHSKIQARNAWDDEINKKLENQ